MATVHQVTYDDNDKYTGECSGRACRVCLRSSSLSVEDFQTHEVLDSTKAIKKKTKNNLHYVITSGVWYAFYHRVIGPRAWHCLHHTMVIGLHAHVSNVGDTRCLRRAVLCALFRVFRHLLWPLPSHRLYTTSPPTTHVLCLGLRFFSSTVSPCVNDQNSLALICAQGGNNASVLERV